MRVRKSSGFTLIELLVVIAIIALLSTMTIANLAVTRTKSRDATRLLTTREMFTALELYNQSYSHYPCSSGMRSDNAGFLQPLVTAGYLSSNPKDPVNKSPYIYWYASFKNTPGGPCGQIAEVNYDIQVANTACLEGGKFASPTHCHIFIPRPLNCSDPYLLTTEGSFSDCSPLAD